MHPCNLSLTVASVACFYAHIVSAIDLGVNSTSSIKSAASSVAHGLMQYYTGNQSGGIPGLLPYKPYFWWESGALMGTLMDYYYYTGDDTYNDIVIQGMMWQASPTNDFMPQNQTTDLGNDDQDFWGFAAMTAAEYRFPNPPSTQPQWLELAQGVWNSQQLRWNPQTCAGGLNWQIYSFNLGYDYKNSPANAGFINMGARLYAYTGKCASLIVNYVPRSALESRLHSRFHAMHSFVDQVYLRKRDIRRLGCKSMGLDDRHWTHRRASRSPSV